MSWDILNVTEHQPVTPAGLRIWCVFLNPDIIRDSSSPFDWIFQLYPIFQFRDSDRAFSEVASWVLVAKSGGSNSWYDLASENEPEVLAVMTQRGTNYTEGFVSPSDSDLWTLDDRLSAVNHTNGLALQLFYEGNTVRIAYETTAPTHQIHALKLPGTDGECPFGGRHKESDEKRICLTTEGIVTLPYNIAICDKCRCLFELYSAE